MARFDLYIDRQDTEQFLLDIQADYHRQLTTRMVTPVVPISRIPHVAQGLHLPVRIDKEEYLITIPYMTVVLYNQLGKKIDNLSHFHDEITQSIDFLLQGF